MGGFGSTRWGGYRKKPLVEGCLTLDFGLPAWKKALNQPAVEGTAAWTVVATGECLLRLRFLLGPIANGSRELVLRFCNDPDEPSQHIVLELVRYPFDERWLARCPGECGRRAVKLRRAPGKWEFVCWRCAGLQYRSAQRHDARLDLLRRDPRVLLQVMEDCLAQRRSFAWTALVAKVLLETSPRQVPPPFSG